METTAAVAIVWWLSLLMTLVVTVVAAMRLVAVANVCREIHELARRVAAGAEGLAGNTAAIAKLGAVGALSPGLLPVVGEIDTAAAQIAASLSSAAAKEQ